MNLQRNGDVFIIIIDMLSMFSECMLRNIVSKNATKRFHINPQLCSNVDMINEILLVHYACSCTLINPEITSFFSFFIVKLQFSWWLQCKNDSYDFLKEHNQPLYSWESKRLNYYWRVFDIWIIVVQEIGGYILCLTNVFVGIPSFDININK